ncbi:hypothetical protein F0L17_10660 [Streptomyces sp. TRM43335]|uniref:Cyanophycinase n=1 Tax=Streptomyces taklimakanensis TaxID=2569853 RepID=A0A6G2BBE5_9ACTN|nr:hypothetical protein [Streptomyces taklimakanensis]MTE19580.1 hypothetical protein [Streptomyces taklimakanensis]
MSIHLIGGGRNEEAAATVHGPFLAEAGTAPTVACLLIDGGRGTEHFARIEAALRAAAPNCTPEPVLVPVGGTFDPSVLDGADALWVGDGPAAAYHDALADVLDTVTLRVMRGMPYAGFSSGASLAAEHAIVGGRLADGIPVCPDAAADGLEEIDVRPGLGLLPGAVETRAARTGTLSRLVEVVTRGRAGRGVALDEDTLLTVDGHRARVSGRGRAYTVRTGNATGDVVVRTYGAGEEFTI